MWRVLGSLEVWARRDPRVVWRGSVPTAQGSQPLASPSSSGKAPARGLQKAHQWWGCRGAYVSLTRSRRREERQKGVSRTC